MFYVQREWILKSLNARSSQSGCVVPVPSLRPHLRHLHIRPPPLLLREVLLEAADVFDGLKDDLQLGQLGLVGLQLFQLVLWEQLLQPLHVVHLDLALRGGEVDVEVLAVDAHSVVRDVTRNKK